MAYIPIMIPLVLIYILMDLLKVYQIHYQELKDLLGFILDKMVARLDKMVARLDMYDGLFLRQTDPNAE
jgi:hypothetical protein